MLWILVTAVVFFVVGYATHKHRVKVAARAVTTMELHGPAGSADKLKALLGRKF